MKQFYQGAGVRDNPKYPIGHCMTLIKCDECGELYEADKAHVCRKKNSYPWEEEGDYRKIPIWPSAKEAET